MRLNTDDTLTTIDLLTETLNQCRNPEVVDFAAYLAKNLDPAILTTFKEVIARVTVRDQSHV